MLYKSKVIVFIGPDGSGKTTAINGIQSELEKNYKIENKHIRFNFIPRIGFLKLFLFSLFKLKVVRNPSPSKSVISSSSQRYIYGPNLKITKICMILIYETIDYLLGLVALYRFNNQTIYIFDRYFYEYYTEVDWQNTPKILMKILMAFIPKPTCIFFMYNSPEVISQRKTELSVDEIAHINKRIELLLKNEKNFEVIKTNESAPRLSQKILEILKSKGIDV